MAVNHDALFLGTEHAAPHLAAALARFPGGESIINNLSMASYMPNATNIGYHVSKSAGWMLIAQPARLLDLDHIGAKIAQHLRAPRTCKHPRQIKDLQSGQRPGALRNRRCHWPV